MCMDLSLDLTNACYPVVNDSVSIVWRTGGWQACLVKLCEFSENKMRSHGYSNNVTDIILGSNNAEIASHLLQFVFISDCGFRFPVANFATPQCPPSVLYFHFWEGVLAMKRAGFT